MMKFIIFISLIGSIAQAQTAPPAPSQPPQPTVEAQPAPKPKTIIEKYQDCFDLMIDKNSDDPNFIKKCLGIRKAAKPEKIDGDQYDFVSIDLIKSTESLLRKKILGCYEEWTRASQEFQSSSSSQILLELTLNNNGKVTINHWKKKNPLDTTYLKCVHKEVTSASFPKFVEESLPVQIRMGWDISAKDKKVQIKPWRSTPVVISADGLSPAEIMTTFEKYANGLQICYQDHLKLFPGSKVRSTVNFKVSPRGRVAWAGFKGDKPSDSNLANCILRQTKKWQFPKPRGGHWVRFDYPFIFQPTP